MPAVLPLSPAPRFPEPRPAYSPQAWSALEGLRRQARRCRSAPRLDLFRACALLSLDKAEAGAAYGEAVLRCFREGLGRAAIIYSPGSAEISFDESWLLRLFTVAEAGDEANFAFLIASRVRPDRRRSMSFLLRNISGVPARA